MTETETIAATEHKPTHHCKKMEPVEPESHPEDPRAWEQISQEQTHTHHEKPVAELDKGGVAIPWNSVAPPETGGYILEESVWMKGKGGRRIWEALERRQRKFYFRERENLNTPNKLNMNT
jgi:hypothetical protein